MQATVKEYDVEAKTGMLLGDDRQEILVDATSMEGSGLRSLRLGQRVRFDVVEEDGVGLARNLRLVTL